MRQLPAQALLLIALAVASLALPTGASAGTGGYASHAWTGCGGGGFNSGSWDSAGRVYVPCGNPTSIGVYDTSARLVQTIHLDYWVTDVAPTRDGTYLYLATADQSKRLKRTADGSYVGDPTWSPQPYDLYGSKTPRGRFVTTDAAGRVYLADGYWSPNNTHTVLVYEPNGTLVTRFGEWMEESWTAGHFYWALGGVAVSNDGTKVYTTESGNNRIQTWTRQPNGSYLPGVTAFGGNAANNPDRAGYCDYDNWLGKFAAPYDVALDQAGYVYVINTTCKQVLKFAPGLGALQANLDVRVAGGDYPRPHGFAVGADGTVYVGENQRMLRPSGGALPADGKPPVRPAPPAPPAPVAPEPQVISPTPQLPPTSTNPIARVDEDPPITMVGSTRTYRTRRGSFVRLTVRCNERCRVDLSAVQRRRIVGRRVLWMPGRVTRRIDVRLARTTRAGGVSMRVQSRDAVGNVRWLGRTTRLLRATRRH